MFTMHGHSSPMVIVGNWNASVLLSWNSFLRGRLFFLHRDQAFPVLTKTFRSFAQGPLTGRPRRLCSSPMLSTFPPQAATHSSWAPPLTELDFRGGLSCVCKAYANSVPIFRYYAREFFPHLGHLYIIYASYFIFDRDRLFLHVLQGSSELWFFVQEAEEFGAKRWQYCSHSS